MQQPSRTTEIFGIDYRALALFRCMIATICLVDFLRMIPYAKLFLSDTGLMPRTTVINAIYPYTWSINFISGLPSVQIILLLIGAFFSVLLLVGCRTKLALCMVWMLKASLYVRAPYINQGGDQLTLVLLFWSFWLPIQHCFSVDAALNSNPTTPPKRACSIATTAILVQAALVWFISAWIKAPNLLWSHGVAIWAVLSATFITTTLAKWLLPYPIALYFLTYYVLYLEFIGPIALFIPSPKQWLRTTAMFCLFTMHLGFLLLLNVGHFPWVSIASIVLFTPTYWLDLLANRLKKAQNPLKIFYDQNCPFCRKLCLIIRTFCMASATIQPAQADQQMGPLLEKNYSWVVQDAQGHITMRWAALLTVYKNSPLSKPFYPLLNLKPLRIAGDHFYSWIGNHRGGLGSLTAWWWQEQPIKPYRLNFFHTILVGVLLAVTIIWNTHTILKHLPTTQISEQTYFKTLVKPAIKLTGLDQDWRMFAPTPVHNQTWVRIYAETDQPQSTRITRLFPTPIAPSSLQKTFQKPNYHTGVYDHPYFRLRKYYSDKLDRFMRAKTPKHAAYRDAFFQHYCQITHADRVQYLQLRQNAYWRRTNKAKAGPVCINLWRTINCKTNQVTAHQLKNVPVYLAKDTASIADASNT